MTQLYPLKRSIYSAEYADGEIIYDLIVCNGNFTVDIIYARKIIQREFPTAKAAYHAIDHWIRFRYWHNTESEWD